MPKMATKRTPKLFNIVVMHHATKKEVATYYEIVDQINFLISQHNYVNKMFIVDAVLKSFKVSDEWFSEMQEHHKQSIIDSVRGPK